MLNSSMSLSDAKRFLSMLQLPSDNKTFLLPQVCGNREDACPLSNNCLMLIFYLKLLFFCFSSQVQRTVTTRTALSWFSPSRRNCYNDDLSEPANVGCDDDGDGNDEEEDKDVDEVTAKNKDGRVYCTLSAVNFFSRCLINKFAIAGLRVPANSLQPGEI